MLGIQGRSQASANRATHAPTSAHSPRVATSSSAAVRPKAESPLRYCDRDPWLRLEHSKSSSVLFTQFHGSCRRPRRFGLLDKGDDVFCLVYRQGRDTTGPWACAAVRPPGVEHRRARPRISHPSTVRNPWGACGATLQADDAGVRWWRGTHPEWPATVSRLSRPGAPRPGLTAHAALRAATLARSYRVASTAVEN